MENLFILVGLAIMCAALLAICILIDKNLKLKKLLSQGISKEPQAHKEEMTSKPDPLRRKGMKDFFFNGILYSNGDYGYILHKSDKNIKPITFEGSFLKEVQEIITAKQMPVETFVTELSIPSYKEEDLKSFFYYGILYEKDDYGYALHNDEEYKIPFYLGALLYEAYQKYAAKEGVSVKVDKFLEHVKRKELQ